MPGFLCPTRHRGLPLWRRRHAETGLPRRPRDGHGFYVGLARSVFVIQQPGVARGQSLSAKAGDLEDVCAASIGGHLQLLMKPRKLVLALDGGENGLWDQGLRVPVSQGTHDGARLFIRVYRAVIGVVVILKRCICIQRSFCNMD